MIWEARSTCDRPSLWEQMAPSFSKHCHGERRWRILLFMLLTPTAWQARWGVRSIVAYMLSSL